MPKLLRWQTWALSFLFWTCFGILDSVGSYTLVASTGEKPILHVLLTWNFAEAYIWVLLTPLIYALSVRFSLTKQGWIRSLLVHAPASLPFTMLSASLMLGFNTVIGRAAGSVPFRTRLLDLMLQDLPRFFITLGVVQAVIYYSNLRQREADAAQLEARLAHAQLEILRGQMDPHFLFNTLNSIATLTRIDPASAERMTIQLSALLRLSLENAGTQIVPLQQELDFLEHYVAIQQTRFRDRLTVRMQVDTELLSTPVPSLILQPLVENAITHGISKSAASGRVDVLVARQNGSLRIEVADNGVGIADGLGWAGDGIGLGNMRTRLNHLYGDAHKLRIDSSPGGGCRVTIALPITNPIAQVSG